MKVLVVFALAIASATANAVYETPVFPKDLIIDGEESSDIEGRITNGAVAAFGQFPYTVGLSLSNPYGTFWCGGSLIGSTWVLTAAHCTNECYLGTAYFGSTTRTDAKEHRAFYRNSIVQHTGFNDYLNSNDISLIKFYPPVTTSSLIQIVKLPTMASSYSTFSGSRATASGWGQTSDTSPISIPLNYAEFTVINNSVCADYYGSAVVTGNTICVSTPGGTSTCQGDSGGPLVLNSNKELIGLSSFSSTAGCKSGAPAGFMRVTSYLGWIRDNTDIAYYW